MSNHNYGPHTPAWRALQRCAEELATTSIGELFALNAARFDAMSVETLGFLLDFSRQRIDEDVLGNLLDLAEQADVSSWVERMFNGERINGTESRPALHVALRRPADAPIEIDGEDIMPLVEGERRKIRMLADALHAGRLTGFTNRPITDVVNIGIGGSDLGLVMAVEALAECRLPGLGVHFVSNIDGVALAHVLERVDPETTLFVICSKSFTTLETLTNARAVRAWLIEHGGERAVVAQCIAVSTNSAAMDEFGIAPDKRFAIWDWVGGRFSLWSSVGLTVALAVGSEHFDSLLHGGHMLDEHFRHELPEMNLPTLLALIGIWNRNFLGAGSHAVLPYDDHLSRFPAYLQQLEMESNGKSVRRNGEPVECATCPVIWGEPGSNAQHSFYQLLHQGTETVSIDFLLPVKSGVGRQAQQDLAAMSCLAQTWALAEGDPEAEQPGPHEEYPGSRPSSLLLFERLDPETLGKLIALYEHKVYVQGIVWDVNSFDQFGVELGKRLATRLMSAADAGGKDPAAIAGSLARWRSWRS